MEQLNLKTINSIINIYMSKNIEDSPVSPKAVDKVTNNLAKSIKKYI